MRAALRILLGIFVSIAASPRPSDAASFMGVGILPGASGSVANAVSGDGSVVVGDSSQAFRWTAATGIVPLDAHSQDITLARGVSADGSVAVGLAMRGGGPFTPPQAVRWTAGGGALDLGTLPDDTISSAFAVSGDGSTVVGLSQGLAVQSDHAFVWTAAVGMVAVGDLPGGAGQTIAYGVSGDGSVVAGTSGGEAFRWTSAGGTIGLGFLPGSSSSGATFVSQDGSVIVGDSGGQAFRWTSSTGMSALGTASAFAFSGATGASADGSIVVGGGALSGSSSGSAFLWDAAHGMRPLAQVLAEDYGLDLTGWTLDTALAVSADGRTIVGSGTDPGGQQEGWIATIPEPTTALLVVLGLAGLAVGRRTAV